MKFFIVLSLLGGSAFADSDFSILPVKIKCTSKAKSREAKKFEIDDLDSDRPDSTISDASLMDIALTPKKLDVSFSNQCDNSYGLTFKVADLVKLKARKFKFVIGKLEYFDTWLSEAVNDETGDAKENLSVYCTL